MDYALRFASGFLLGALIRIVLGPLTGPWTLLQFLAAVCALMLIEGAFRAFRRKANGGETE